MIPRLPEVKPPAYGCSKQVAVYVYGARSAEVWWANQRQSLDRLKNLSVMLLPMDSVHTLAELAKPSKQLQWTIQNKRVWISDGTQTVHIELRRVKSP